MQLDKSGLRGLEVCLMVKIHKKQVFVAFDKRIMKFIWKFKFKPRIAKTILKLIVSDLKTHCIAKIIKIMWYWKKEKHRKQ